MPKILSSHFSAFRPILKTLSDQGWELLVMSGQFATELGNTDLEAKPLQQFAQGMQDGAFAWSTAVIQELPKVLDAELRNGVNPIVSDWLRKNAGPFYYPRLADLGMLILALDEAKPDLILLHNDVEPITRAAALWAKGHKVPCLHVPHAIYQMVNRTKLGTDIHDLITASHLAVSGPFQREWYLRCGAKPEQIIVTGLPQHDGWARRNTISQAQARMMLKLDQNGPPVVVWAGTWPQTTNIGGANPEWQIAYTEFIQAMLDLDVQVLIKCHPSGGEQNWQYHARVANDAGLDVTVTPQHLEVCIDAADLMIAYAGSNVLLEASFNPRVRLAATHGYDNDRAVARIPMDTDGIKAAVSELLSKPPARTGALQTKYLGECDGQNWQRITDVCLKLSKLRKIEEISYYAPRQN